MTTRISPFHHRPSHRPRHPNLNMDKVKARYFIKEEIMPDGRSVMESPCDMWPHAFVQDDDSFWLHCRFLFISKYSINFYINLMLK